MSTQPLATTLKGIATMLVVDDLPRSVAFYRDKRGFDVENEQEHIAFLVRDSMRLYLFTQSLPTPDKPTVTLASLNTPDQTPVILVFMVTD